MSSLYLTEDVERLLLMKFTGAWDLANEYAPDSDMPKATPALNRTGTNLAHKVDIDRAYRSCEFTQSDQMVLYLRYGCEKTIDQVAEELQFTKGSVKEVLEWAVAELVSELNTAHRRKEARDDADQERELRKVRQRISATMM